MRRRWWIALIPIVLVPLAAAYVSHQQTTLYQASANVLVNYSDVSAVTAATTNERVFSQEDANTFLATQASIARAPAIARKTLDAAHLKKRSTQQFLSRSTASVSSGTAIMTLTVTDHQSGLAKKLVGEYAAQYIAYRKGLDTGAISRTIAKITGQLKSFKSAAQRRSIVYFGLVRQRDLLRTQLGLRTASAFLVSAAQSADLVQPLTARNVAIGLGVGLVLGIALAFLLDALDTRVRSTEEIADALGLPVLAAIPPAPRKLPSDRFLMIEDPKAHEAEAFRMLRANLAFADVEGDVRSLMVCSALPDEGKTTTVGNLAVALASAGRSVIVVDLDLRRPGLARAFGLKGKPGVTNAALGQVPIDDALHPIAVGSAADAGTNGHGNLDALLRVMPSGPLPPSPGEFAASGRVAKLLKDLRSKADVVLIDTAPLLSVGDGLALAANVDGVLVVSRVRVIKRRSLKGLRARLDSIGARKLGVVATGVKGGDAYYGYYGGYGQYATDPSEPMFSEVEVEPERTGDEAVRETRA